MKPNPCIKNTEPKIMLTILLLTLAMKARLFSRPASILRQWLSIRKTTVLLILFLQLMPLKGRSQEYLYAILKGSDVIGTLSAKRSETNGHEVLHVQSKAKIRFLLTIQVEVMIRETFESGKLNRSTIVRTVNGRENIRNTAESLASGYLLKKKNEKETLLYQDIRYSMGQMYFTEPDSMEQVYSEHYQLLIPVTSTSPHRYLVKFPNGNKSYYDYVNGICTAVEAHTDLATITFKLIESAGSLYTKK